MYVADNRLKWLFLKKHVLYALHFWLMVSTFDLQVSI